MYFLHLSSVQHQIPGPEMHKVQGDKCAISKLMYGSSVCTDDYHLLKLVAYRLAHTDEPYISLHLLNDNFGRGLQNSELRQCISSYTANPGLTRIVRGSDFSSATALSEFKDMFGNITLFGKKLMAHKYQDVDIVNDNNYVCQLRLNYVYSFSRY